MIAMPTFTGIAWERVSMLGVLLSLLPSLLLSESFSAGVVAEAREFRAVRPCFCTLSVDRVSGNGTLGSS